MSSPKASVTESALRSLLERVAPGVGGTSVPLDAELRRALDLDSMEFLEFCIALEREHGVTVPESDYEQVSTLAGCLAYLAAHCSPA